LSTELSAEALEQVSTARNRIEAAHTRDEIVNAGTELEPALREFLVTQATEHLRTSELTEATEHWLERYHSLLPPNPRSITRFVTAFSVISSVRLAENVWIPSDPLARWLVLQMRWPVLAEYLRAHPDAVSDGRLLPPELRQLADLHVAARVLTENGEPFTPARVRECAGSPAGNV
jgi:hypothetical protein